MARYTTRRFSCHQYNEANCTWRNFQVNHSMHPYKKPTFDLTSWCQIILSCRMYPIDIFFQGDQHTFDKTTHVLKDLQCQIYFGIEKSLIWKGIFLDLTRSIYHLCFFATMVWVLFSRCILAFFFLIIKSNLMTGLYKPRKE